MRDTTAHTLSTNKTVRNKPARMKCVGASVCKIAYTALVALYAEETRALLSTLSTLSRSCSAIKLYL